MAVQKTVWSLHRGRGTDGKMGSLLEAVDDLAHDIKVRVELDLPRTVEAEIISVHERFQLLLEPIKVVQQIFQAVDQGPIGPKLQFFADIICRDQFTDVHGDVVVRSLGCLTHPLARPHAPPNNNNKKEQHIHKHASCKRTIRSLFTPSTSSPFACPSRTGSRFTTWIVRLDSAHILCNSAQYVLFPLPAGPTTNCPKRTIAHERSTPDLPGRRASPHCLLPQPTPPPSAPSTSFNTSPRFVHTDCMTLHLPQIVIEGVSDRRDSCGGTACRGRQTADTGALSQDAKRRARRWGPPPFVSRRSRRTKFCSVEGSCALALPNGEACRRGKVLNGNSWGEGGDVDRQTRLFIRLLQSGRVKLRTELPSHFGVTVTDQRMVAARPENSEKPRHGASHFNPSLSLSLCRCHLCLHRR